MKNNLGKYRKGANQNLLKTKEEKTKQVVTYVTESEKQTLLQSVAENGFPNVSVFIYKLLKDADAI